MANSVDWWGVVKSAGSAVIETAVPGGGAIVKLVNEFLPDDDRLPSTATGDQVRSAVESLTAAWPLLLAVVATPTALLRAYFGMRTREKEARYSAASGQPVNGGPMSALMDMVGKRLGA